MQLPFEMSRRHIFLSGLHFVRVAPYSIDFPVMYHKAVGVCSLPAWIGIGAESGMYHGNGRFIIFILQIRKKSSKLPYQKHTLVDNGPAGHGNHISIVIALLKNSSGNVQLPVKIKPFLHTFRLFDKGLHNMGHTFFRFVSQYLGIYRDFPVSQQFQAFLFGNDFKHFLCLSALYLILWEKQLCNSVFPFSPNGNVQLLTDLCKKFMGNLQKDSHTVSGLALRVFPGAVFQIFHNAQRPFYGLVAFDTFAVYHSADTAVIVFKCGAV